MLLLTQLGQQARQSNQSDVERGEIASRNG